MRSILILTLLSLAPCAQAAICESSVTDLVFGNYRFNSDTHVETDATISITCEDDLGSPVVSYEISIGTGMGGNFSPRTMNGPGASLQYNLYTDPGRTVIWGDGTGGTDTASGTFVLPATTSASHTAYGRIPSGLTGLTAGSYSDQLTITITY